MIIGYFGNVGDGKTYNAVKLLSALYLKGYAIYSNIWLAFPHNHLTLEFLEDIVKKGIKRFNKVVFLIDEIHIWLDSRCSATKRNRIISYFLSQTRKLSSEERGLILLFTTQYHHQVDKRLKSFLDIGTDCEKLIIGRERYFKLTINNYKGLKSFSYNKIVRCNPSIYGLYDTSEIVMYEDDSDD